MNYTKEKYFSNYRFKIQSALIRSVNNSIQNLLSFNYNSMFDFFNKNFFEYTCNKSTVLVSRRCLLIAELFLLRNIQERKDKFELTREDGCFCIKNKSNGLKNYIISDKGVITFLANRRIFSEISTCTIVDDIAIHGRHLEKIKRYISSLNFLANDKKVEIETYVYMKSADSIIYNPTKCAVETYDATWLTLSKKIVNMINVSNMPYVSYLNSYTKCDATDEEFDDFITKIDKNDNLDCVRFGDDGRTNLGKLSYFIVEKKSNYNKYEQFRCVRYYHNYKTGVTTVIPYVVINNKLEAEALDNKDYLKTIFNEYLNDSAAENLSDWLVKEYVDVLKEYKFDLQEENIEADCTDYKFLVNHFNKNIYYLLSCIASKSYGQYFFDKYNICLDEKSGFAQDCINCLDLTFDSHIVDIISDKSSYKQSIVGNRSVSIDIEQLDMFRQKYYNAIDLFCKGRWVFNEEYAISKEETQSKISINDILSAVVGKVNDTGDITELMACLCIILDYCDSGFLSISCSNRLECVIDAGELSVLSARNWNNSATLITDTQAVDDFADNYLNADIINEKIKGLMGIRYYRLMLL